MGKSKAPRGVLVIIGGLALLDRVLIKLLG